MTRDCLTDVKHTAWIVACQHTHEEEGFYILEGEPTIRVGDERFVAVAGTFANMPVGSLHSFKNESSRSDRRPGIVEAAIAAARGMNRN